MGDDAPARDSTNTAATNAALLALNDPALPFPYVLPEPGDTPRSGGTLRIGWHQDLLSLDPTRSTSAGALMIPNLVCNRLLGLVGNAELHPYRLAIRPELATSWERSPDGLRYTFRLDERARWQDVPPVDGRRLVAADVLRSYERYRSAGVHRGYLANVVSLAAPDDATLEIVLGHPQPDFETPLATRNLPILPPELLNMGPLDAGLDAGSAVLVGSGPMLLDEALRGSHVTLRRDPAYWAGDVRLDGVQVSIVPEQSARMSGMREGRYEYASNVLEHVDEAHALMEARPEMGIHLLPALSSQFSIALRLERPPFDDVRVRRALLLAVDREQLIEQLYGGLARVLPGTPWQFLFDREPVGDALGSWLRHAPAEARALLDAADTGHVTFELRYHNYREATNRRANELIAEDFADIGVSMTQTALAYAPFNEQWSANAYAEAADGYAPTGFTTDAYFSDAVRSDGPLNRWGIADPQIDEWAERQSRELDPQARREIVRRIWDRLLDQAYRIEKVAPFGFELYQPWLRNMRVVGQTGDIGLHIADVWLDEPSSADSSARGKAGEE